MSHDIKRYCPLCQKREERSECSYGQKVWDKVSIRDEEYSMARSELSNMDSAVERLMNILGRGEGNLESWVQSKITKAADYIDTVADYLESGEPDFDSVSESKNDLDLVDKIIGEEKKKGGKEVPNCVPKSSVSESIKQAVSNALFGSKEKQIVAAKQKSAQKKAERSQASVTPEKDPWSGNRETDKAWAKGGASTPTAYRNEDITIQDANGNDYIQFVDLIRPDPLISEASRLQAQTGNIVEISLQWRGKYYSLRMFFPNAKLPSRKEIKDELQKVYPGCIVVNHFISDFVPGQPLIQMGSKNYVKPMGEEVEIDEAKKSEMPCNKPKAESHGSGETGKSHVVKACSDGKEKLIRFGQKGVKGSPKKEGESKEYASRRHKFQTRHAKNIARGPMSAAYWANKVKW